MFVQPWKNGFPGIVHAPADSDGAYVDDDDFDTEAYLAQDPTAREQLLRGEAPAQAPAAAEPAPQPAAQEPAPAQLPQEPAPPANQPPAQPPGGDRLVPIGALHEERGIRRTLEQQAATLQEQNQQLLGLLARFQPGSGAPGQEPAQVPGLVHEDPAAVQHLIEQAVAPLRQENGELKKFVSRFQEREQINALAQQYQDPELPAVLDEFDQVVPELKHLPPQVRYFTALGLMQRSPRNQAQQTEAVQAQARDAAVQMVTERLTQQPQRPTPVDLGNVPPARTNEAPLTIEDLDPSQYGRMDEAKRRAILRGV